MTATRIARFLRGGDFWRAYQAVECAYKGHLRAILKWHSRAHQGPEVETWYDGRLLAEWADPHAVSELPATCADFHPDSLWQALEGSLSLFHRLAPKTAMRLEYPYPQDFDDHITRWIDSVLYNTSQGGGK